MPHYIYRRVSTRQQAESKGGMQAQYDACVQWAINNKTGWGFTTNTDDPGVKSSVHPYDRPGFGELMKILKPGDCILVYKRDRICRDSLQLAILERDLNKQGIQIISSSGVGNGRTPEDKLVNALLDAVAEYERALIRMRTKAEKQAKKERGEVYCRSVYGYKNVDGKMVPDPLEQEAIVYMQVMHNQGDSFRWIAKMMNQNNEYPPPRGTLWHPNTIREILMRQEENNLENS